MSDEITAPEREHFDRKSLRTVTGGTADFAKIAQDCVCFANGAGGALWIGIEDGQEHPPPGQKIDPLLLERIRKRIGELTVNVQVLPEVRRDPNGGEIIVLSISRSVGVASTADGRYFLRIGDSCQPIVGDDVLRLANERPAVPWEMMTSLEVPRKAANATSVARWAAAVRASERVKTSVKEKSDHELLAHYGLSTGGLLTNLGVLLVGDATDRAKLGSAPVVQAIKYDERGTKVSKHLWDDYSLSPVDLVDAVWNGVPDFRESYELPDGLLRTTIPAFEEVVVRELLVNALVHRPYTQRGDIFINLHPDRLEIVNPGRLEGTDSVHVTVPRRVVHPSVISLIADVDEQYQLTQRERIALAMLAQTEGLSAAELMRGLELDDAESLSSWIARLVELGLVHQAGRTRGTRYFVWPELVRSVGLDRRTTLARIEPHRLRALIVEDLKRYPDSKRVDIHRRIAPEIHSKAIVRMLNALISEKLVVATGEKRWRTYRLA